jgi:hypothetical protein
MAHTQQDPDQGIDWGEAVQLEDIQEISPRLYLVPAPRSPRRKRDLWGRLKSILVGRLQVNYGLSQQEADIQTEKWLHPPTEPKLARRLLGSKVIAIR